MKNKKLKNLNDKLIRLEKFAESDAKTLKININRYLKTKRSFDLNIVNQDMFQLNVVINELNKTRNEYINQKFLSKKASN